MTPPRTAAALVALVDGLAALGRVTDVLVAGSLASGDYVEGVSDLDLVALVDGSVDDGLVVALTALHRALDAGLAAGLDLGCVYVDVGALAVTARTHPTWTHGHLVHRILSGVTRTELVLTGSALSGRTPAQLLPPVGPDDVRRAARDELTGYWASTVRRPWWFLDPVLADLGLTAVERGRHALTTGTLLTKTAAIDAVVPTRLRAELRARRRGEAVTSPRTTTAWHAWRAVRSAVRLARSASVG